MRATPRQLAVAVTELLAEGGKQELVFKDLLQFLQRKNLLRHSDKVVAAIEEFSNEEKGELPVLVTTAHPLTTTHKALVTRETERLFPEKKTRLTFREKPSLIGGIRIETANTLYDGTLSYSLRKLSQSL